VVHPTRGYFARWMKSRKGKGKGKGSVRSCYCIFSSASALGLLRSSAFMNSESATSSAGIPSFA
jgi:hypothetical protein